MRAYDLILKKRNGAALSREELHFLVDGFVRGDVPDYQMSAFLMAVFFRDMTAPETADLTLVMAHSGETMDLSPIPGVKVDKHSSGGVGDKTSIVLVPLVASLGVPVAKMSGRGLGHTGGTLDKLETIAGCRTEISGEAFFDQVRRVGCAIVGQTADLVPADKKLYALRDVTGTVDSIPLIASSIMSKKIAGGADAIVLDVKCGGGAFMRDVALARRLAQAMIEIGEALGRRMAAVISDMDQPLGDAIGNALEVHEAIATLRGAGPADLRELCLVLGAKMAMLGGVAANEVEARARLEESLGNGAAAGKLGEMIRAQGGDATVVDDPDRLPRAPVVRDVTAAADGHVHHIDAMALGLAAMALGAGRARKGDDIDPAVGVVLEAKVGAAVRAGDVLARVHARDAEHERAAVVAVRDAYTIDAMPAAAPPLIRAVLG
ncbi:MAG: pyrimidine-nucleoside phosphorylase [Armatimonadetes bacterium]|nr:pyrimidine-nucleoside phosphorylase [Armatimonadota bacterium]